MASFVDIFSYVALISIMASVLILLIAIIISSAHEMKLDEIERLKKANKETAPSA